ncbi:hypothetical protein DERF_000800 [Dermatophagoides farinae]|uniref:Uncharacterized protein n=1 Tax=Dermatophagoides farinae TaxID=6954 RepID=A0A922I9L8_DERFA|nr:hypothetical protein DERF_000800 [Dermatophagoides farinae]
MFMITLPDLLLLITNRQIGHRQDNLQDNECQKIDEGFTHHQSLLLSPSDKKQVNDHHHHHHDSMNDNIMSSWFIYVVQFSK